MKASIILVILAFLLTVAVPLEAQVLNFSTYFGGNAFDRAQGVDIDDQGFIYLAFNVHSSNLPTSENAYDRTYGGGTDAYVAKLTADGKNLVWATYLEGSSQDRGYTVRVDDLGFVYVAVWTQSTNFPTTPGAFDQTHNGGMDVAIVKLATDGSAIVWSSFLGGSLDDQSRNAIFVDDTGSVYVSGWTDSTNFPTTSGVVQTTHAGGGSDVFVTRFKADGSGLIFSTFLGGSADDEGNRRVLVHTDGTVYVAGHTNSTDFPVTLGAFQTIYGGDTGTRLVFSGDAFVARFLPDGSGLVYSTYIGGSGDDHASFNDGMVLNAAGEAIVIGDTTSNDFPVTPSAFQSSLAGGSFDGFVVKISSDGSRMSAGTYIGGTGVEETSGVAVDAIGQVYFSGNTSSNDYPVTSGTFQSFHAGGGDAVLSILSPDFSALLYSTYIGGALLDRGRELTINSANNVYISGDTRSGNFPTTPGVFQPTHAPDGGDADGFVLMFSASPSPPRNLRTAP